MKLLTTTTALTAILALAVGDPLHAVAEHALALIPRARDGPAEWPALSRRSTPLGPNGDCLGKTFFLYPVFKKLELAPGEQQVAFTGLEDIRSLIVLVSDRSFVFEMHGQRYEPAVAHAPLPDEAWVLVEWPAPDFDSAGGRVGAASQLPIPTQGYPIEDEREARAAAMQPLDGAECRIVEKAGFLDQPTSATSARNGARSTTVFGSTISVDPHTNVTVSVPRRLSGYPEDGPRTIWVSLFAAWEYDVDKA